MKTKRDMVVGQKVRGYGLLNEFGEFDFIPEQTGSRKGKIKVVKEGEGFKVSSTTNTIQVLISLEKEKSNEKMELMSKFMNKVNNILLILKDYDI